MKFYIQTIILCYVFVGSNAFANGTTAGGTDALIKGFTKWQANRIERIILDEAMSDITADPYVKRYFPDTAQNVSAYNSVSSKRLIPLMQHYIKKDVQRLSGIMNACIPANINSWFTGDDISVRAEKAKALYVGLKSLASLGNGGDSYTTSKFVEGVCKGEIDKPQPISIDKANLSDIALDIYNHLKSAPKTAGFPAIPEKPKDFFKPEYLINLVESIEKYKIIDNSSNSMTVRVHQAMLAIEQFGKINENDFVGYSKFKSTGLFFASLADASDKTADDVVAVLDSYIDDHDAFIRKRSHTAYRSSFEHISFDDQTNKVKKKGYISYCSGSFYLPCKDTLFLSSYYGVSYINLAENSLEEREWNFRAFGPVGIELKLMTFRSAPLTINLAPIDIGNYITNELKGGEYDAKFEDILAPSIFLAYSSRSKPFSILAGYQKGIKVDDNFETEGPFISIAFDLPIITIY